MVKYNLVNSMIGRVYPFFLNNTKLLKDPSYYLYRIISPKLSPDLVPYISLEKISEKTKVGDPKEPYGNGSDVVALCSSKKLTKDSCKEIISSILWKDNPIIDDNGTDFPLIEMENGNNIQKSIIVGLRDLIRWNNYKLLPGNYIDVLWTPKTFVLFKINGDKAKEVWIEPVGIYKNDDPNMKYPLPIDISKIDFPKDKWSISKGKISEFNRAIKKLEWDSFGKKEISY